MNSINKTARMAGLFYFIYILASIIADLFGHFVFADASATVNHIMTHPIAISYRCSDQYILICVVSSGGLVFVQLAKTG